MSTETALLHAITANRSDNTARLAFADWLDENGEPDRAAYLRLQVELVREWWYDKPCTELYARMAELAGRIDPAWLAAVRRCTTPAPPVNVEEALPDLRGKAKTAVRLHPRPGEAPVDASKIGGMFLWPKNEPWPVCPIHDSIPYVTALQLRKEDVPELGFPTGTDLFQLLWCPQGHDEDDMYCPKPAVYWRKRASVKRTLAAAPEPADVEYGYFPRLCVLYPERVTEYPDPFEFHPAGIGYDIEGNKSPNLCAALAVAQSQPAARELRPPAGADDLYQFWLSTTEGTKVGGYPDWVQDSHYPNCGCGAKMEHLLSFGSWEWGGSNRGRWVAVEDRPILSAGFREQESVHRAHGCTFGDAGRMYVFVCRNHREPHIRAFMQCS
ncbi:hypothetical protein VT84_15395 [Gemmata sp. SH-PL17]|uniref:TIGR02996 domain-containing protein n=1 Tax=Gemmata sp. SH-PL17 TaxID=1630693 RepID=UPI0004B609B6|nr:TIGR02996 domain-containing protein [Gemmata sp. SH-PL17]AMV25781.1 hypothetical protein VT84_15395 [Gemmata sp. SH-PL17]